MLSLLCLPAANSHYAAAQTLSQTDVPLEELIEKAFNHHPDLLRLKAELDITKEDVALAKAAYRPQVSANGNVNFSQRNSVLQSGVQFDQNTIPQEVSLQLSQTLYAGGRRRLSIRIAENNLAALQAEYQVGTSGIADGVINDYINLMQAYKNYDILDENVKALIELETAVSAQQKAGDSSITDIAQTTARLATAKAQHSQTWATLTQARNALLSSTNYFIDKYNMPAAAISAYDTPLELAIEKARDKSFQIQSARYSEKSADYNLRNQKRGWLPTIALNASARAQRDTSPTIDTDNDLRAGISVTVPLYAGGEGRSNIRRANAQLSAAKHNIRNSFRLTDDQITQLYSRLLNGRNVLQAQEENIAANEKTLEGISAAEKAGFADISDVLDAQQSKLFAEIAHAESLHELYRIRLLLRLYTGALDISAGL